MKHHLWQFVGKALLFKESTLIYTKLRLAVEQTSSRMIGRSGRPRVYVDWDLASIRNLLCSYIFIPHFFFFTKDLIYVPVTLGCVNEHIVWKPYRERKWNILRKLFQCLNVSSFKNKYMVWFYLNIFFFHI